MCTKNVQDYRVKVGLKRLSFIVRLYSFCDLKYDLSK